MTSFMNAVCEHSLLIIKTQVWEYLAYLVGSTGVLSFQTLKLMFCIINKLC